MADLLDELGPDYRDRFERLMHMRDADGHVLKTADEVAVDLLKTFVTEHGALQPDIVQRIGPATQGRKHILPDLVAALTGPAPVPQAWLDAQRGGGFDPGPPITYGSRRTKGERVLGAPGVYLQRMLAAYRDAAADRRVSAVERRVRYTETALLTTAIIIRELKEAVRARMALGPAWVVAKAAHALSDKVRRQMDALSSNDDYIQAIGQAVEEITTAFASQVVSERTNAEVRASLPPGEDVGKYFADLEVARAKAASDRLVEAIYKHLAGEASDAADPELDAAVMRVVEATRTAIGSDADVAVRVAAATSYLDKGVDLTCEELEAHRERLRMLMPMLARPSDPKERLARAVLAARFCREEKPKYTMTADPKTDRVLAGILNRIQVYATRKGPPPPGTPVEHIPYFEAIGGFLDFSGQYWPAHMAWRKAGLVPDDMEFELSLHATMQACIDDSGMEGLQADHFAAALAKIKIFD